MCVCVCVCVQRYLVTAVKSSAFFSAIYAYVHITSARLVAPSSIHQTLPRAREQFKQSSYILVPTRKTKNKKEKPKCTPTRIEYTLLFYFVPLIFSRFRNHLSGQTVVEHRARARAAECLSVEQKSWKEGWERLRICPIAT